MMRCQPVSQVTSNKPHIPAEGPTPAVATMFDKLSIIDLCNEKRAQLRVHQHGLACWKLMAAAELRKVMMEPHVLENLYGLFPAMCSAGPRCVW